MPETITELKVILDEVAESWERRSGRIADATNDAIKAATEAMQSGQEKH